jgi:hypothetical protein
MVPIPAGETHPQAIARRLWLREKWRRQKRIQRQRAKGITPFRPTRHRLLRVVDRKQRPTIAKVAVVHHLRVHRSARLR